MIVDGTRRNVVLFAQIRGVDSGRGTCRALLRFAHVRGGHRRTRTRFRDDIAPPGKVRRCHIRGVARAGNVEVLCHVGRRHCGRFERRSHPCSGILASCPLRDSFAGTVRDIPHIVLQHLHDGRRELAFAQRIGVTPNHLLTCNPVYHRLINPGEPFLELAERGGKRRVSSLPGAGPTLEGAGKLLLVRRLPVFTLPNARPLIERRQVVCAPGIRQNTPEYMPELV